MTLPNNKSGPLATGRPNAESPPTGPSGSMVPLAADMLRDVVDLVGTQAEREHAAYQRGHAAGYQRGRADGEEAGYLRHVDEVKKLHLDVVDALELDLRRWPPKGRRSFGQPRPDDFPGRGAA